jgi:hypothetical protein
MATSFSRLIGFGLMSLAVCGAAAAKSPNQPVQLFDGKSLTGWTAAGGQPATSNWSVEDGMLALKGVGGSLFTAEEYGDFDLSFQWKIAPRGNSGVKYRVNFYQKGVHGRPGWLGCEYQIFDDADSKPTKYSTGAIYDLSAPATERLLRPAGEFNDSRIVVVGTKIEHWLNGVMIVSADMGGDVWKQRLADSKFNNVKDLMKKPKGHIQLQDHRSRVWFRNLVLTPLDER